MTLTHYATTLAAGIGMGFLLGAALVHSRLSAIIRAGVFEHDGAGYSVTKMGGE